MPNVAPSQIELATLQRRRDLLLRKKQLVKNNGIAFYVPHKKQDIFHTCDKPRRYVRTGNRFGKSDMGAAEDVAWALGYRPWYQNDLQIIDGSGDLYRSHTSSSSSPSPYITQGIPHRSTKGLILCSDWDKAKEIFTNLEDGQGLGKLWKLIPKSAIAQQPHKNHSGSIDVIYIRSRWGGISTIYIDTVKSYKSNTLGAESSNWDYIHVDEPIPEDMWKAHARGLIDSGGSAWFACTPISEPWINDYFIPSIAGRRQNPDENALTTYDVPKFNKRAVIVGNTRDNPYLLEENIQAFEEDLTPEEIQCRIEGVPSSQSGKIYKQFEYDKHVYIDTPKTWVEMDKPPKDYTIRVSIDPHPQTPHAVLFAATSPFNQTFFFSEIFQQILIEDLCTKIKEITRGYSVLRFLCDPIAWINNPVTNECMADDFYKHGIPVEKATKELQRGILSVQSALRRSPQELFFSQGCETTLWEFERYAWDDKKLNKPVDKDDHFMECLYRLVLDGLDYVAPDDGRIYQYKPQDLTSVSLSLPNTDKLISGASSYSPRKSNRSRYIK